MDTYLVTSENVVLSFREGEEIEPRRAVADTLRKRGLAQWPALEAELYHGARETLLLARPAPPACLRGRACPLRLRRYNTEI